MSRGRACLIATLLGGAIAAVMGSPVSAGAESPAYADGTFVTNAATVYRIAGGAPIVVTSWAAFGGEQPATAISDADLAALPTVPASGTVISGAARGEAYVVAGGAPIFVSDWAELGGVRQSVPVDDAAIDHAGEPGAFSRLRAVPANGTLVRSGTTGPVLEVASGHVAGTEAQGPAVAVDPAAIRNAGTGGVWNHLRMVPLWNTAPVVSSPVFTATPPVTPTAAAPPPPVVLTAPALPPGLRVVVRRMGHEVHHGWLCLATSRTSPVAHRATSVGGCVCVAAHGSTAITPRSAGSYYLVLVGRARHVSGSRSALMSGTPPIIRWTL